MDSKEILQQYLTGSIQPSSAIAELNKLIVNTSDSSKSQESAKARYVLGFIHRLRQYKAGEASAMDMRLNIRDLALILGRLKLNNNLYTLIKESAGELGFRHRPMSVTCTHFDKMEPLIQNVLLLVIIHYARGLFFKTTKASNKKSLYIPL